MKQITFADASSCFLNEDDPKQLKKVLLNLIQKSKGVVSTLELTLTKLQKAEEERDFWKQHYLNLRESCNRFIDSKCFEPMMEKSEEDRSGLILSGLQQKSPLKQTRENERSSKKRGMGSKSISIISLSKENQVRSAHKIGPKRISLFKMSSQKKVNTNYN